MQAVILVINLISGGKNLGWLLDRLFPSRAYSRGYWKGRGEGWRACEDMILERAEKLGKQDEVWKELVQ